MANRIHERVDIWEARLLQELEILSSQEEKDSLEDFVRAIEPEDISKRLLALVSIYAPVFPNAASTVPSKALNTPKKSFLILPPELRVKIYELVLKCDESVEFSPLPDMSSESLHRTPTVGSSRRKSQIHYLKEVRPLLRLLQVSKVVHNEASAVFYGKNEFRFTSCFGLIFLNRLLNTIGPDNVNHLTHISVHFPMRVFQDIDEILPFNWHLNPGLSNWERTIFTSDTEDELRRVRLLYAHESLQDLSKNEYKNIEWAFHRSPDRLFVEILAQLDANDHLQSLKFIIPDWYKLDGFLEVNPENDSPFDHMTLTNPESHSYTSELKPNQAICNALQQSQS